MAYAKNDAKNDNTDYKILKRNGIGICNKYIFSCKISHSQ